MLATLWEKKRKESVFFLNPYTLLLWSPVSYTYFWSAYYKKIGCEYFPITILKLRWHFNMFTFPFTAYMVRELLPCFSFCVPSIPVWDPNFVSSVPFPVLLVLFGGAAPTVSRQITATRFSWRGKGFLFCCPISSGYLALAAWLQASMFVVGPSYQALPQVVATWCLLEYASCLYGG